MLENIKKERVLFLDIETVSQYPQYSNLPENFKLLWDKKASVISRNELDTADLLYERAGIYPEFGKIICISVGFLRDDIIRVKSFAGDNEREVLEDFAELLDRSFNKSNSTLCAHNGKEFDYPFIARRMLINGIKLPSILNISGLKPWDVKLLDTMELWKFGDYKNYTSLDLLTAVFEIPSPKDDIKGSEVGKTYWIDNDLARIVAYCQKDVIAIVQLFLKFRAEPIIPEESILIL